MFSKCKYFKLEQRKIHALWWMNRQNLTQFKSISGSTMSISSPQRKGSDGLLRYSHTAHDVSVALKWNVSASGFLASPPGLSLETLSSGFREEFFERSCMLTRTYFCSDSSFSQTGGSALATCSLALTTHSPCWTQGPPSCCEQVCSQSFFLMTDGRS